MMVTFLSIKGELGNKPLVNYYCDFNIHLYSDTNRKNEIGYVNLQNESLSKLLNLFHEMGGKLIWTDH